MILECNKHNKHTNMANIRSAAMDTRLLCAVQVGIIWCGSFKIPGLRYNLNKDKVRR